MIVMVFSIRVKCSSIIMLHKTDAAIEILALPLPATPERGAE
jgi:hypothetical protein